MRARSQQGFAVFEADVEIGRVEMVGFQRWKAWGFSRQDLGLHPGPVPARTAVLAAWQREAVEQAARGLAL